MRVLRSALLALALLPLVAVAQQSPTGRWKTIDDETGKVKSIVEITQAADGTLQGKVVEILQSDRGPNPTCDKCKGANKDKPVKGKTILWGLEQDGDEWNGGTGLDPATGKTHQERKRVVQGKKMAASTKTSERQ